MSSEKELNSFESELAALRPQSGGLDRDRLLFLAGRASVGGRHEPQRRRSGLWLTAAAATGAVAAAVFVALLVPPRIEVVERIVEKPSAAEVRQAPQAVTQPDSAERRPNVEPRREPPPAPSRFAAALAGWLPASGGVAPHEARSYPALRDAVLAHGLDALPNLPAAAEGGGAHGAAPSYRQLRDSLLDDRPAASPPSARRGRGIPFFSGANS